MHNLHTLFVLFLSSFDNNFILIGHSTEGAETKNSWRSKNRKIRAKVPDHGLSPANDVTKNKIMMQSWQYGCEDVFF